jgi:DnaJ-class molecular chaperone
MPNKFLPWEARNPHKCPDCRGLGMKVHEVPCDLYPHGITTEAYTCTSCAGSGRRMPEVPDMKMAAAGDSI